MNTRINQAKENISTGVNPITYNANRLPIGVGYIVLGREYSRKTYIQNCYRNNTVTIKTDKDEIIKNCFVDKSSWNHIDFPFSYKDLGSLVVWVNIPIQNRCVVIAVIGKKDELIEASINKAFFGKKSENGSALTSADSDKGSMITTIETQSDNGGMFNNIFSKETIAKYKLYVQGDIDIEAERPIVLKSKDTIEFYVGNEEESNVNKLTKITISAESGISIMDQFKNVISVDETGISLTDLFKNQIFSDEEGINLIDQFGNKFISNKDGVLIIDKNNNSYTSNKDGIDIEDNNKNSIKCTNSGLTILVGSNNKTIELKEDGSDTDYVPLYQKTSDKLTSIIDSMSSICRNMQTFSVIYPAGTPTPAAILAFSELQVQIEDLKTDLSQISSKTVKIS